MVGRARLQRAPSSRPRCPLLPATARPAGRRPLGEVSPGRPLSGWGGGRALGGMCTGARRPGLQVAGADASAPPAQRQLRAGAAARLSGERCMGSGAELQTVAEQLSMKSELHAITEQPARLGRRVTAGCAGHGRHGSQACGASGTNMAAQAGSLPGCCFYHVMTRIRIFRPLVCAVVVGRGLPCACAERGPARNGSKADPPEPAGTRANCQWGPARAVLRLGIAAGVAAVP